MDGGETMGGERRHESRGGERCDDTIFDTKEVYIIRFHCADHYQWPAWKTVAAEMVTVGAVETATVGAARAVVDETPVEVRTPARPLAT